MRRFIRTMTAKISGRRVDPAEELLRERYARGEIDDEGYERSLAILRRDGGIAEGSGARLKILVAGLAAAVLLTGVTGLWNYVSFVDG